MTEEEKMKEEYKNEPKFLRDRTEHIYRVLYGKEITDEGDREQDRKEGS